MPRGNWVDRGDPLESTLARVLGHAVGRAADDPALGAHVLTIRGMVEADSTEVHVSGYLRTVAVAFDQPEFESVRRRTLAIALWHIAKTGLVRDAAARHVAALRQTLPPEPPLAEQLHTAIVRAPVEAPMRAPFAPPLPHEVAARRRREP